MEAPVQPGEMSRPSERLLEWGKALLLALLLLTLMHAFVLRWISVRDASMYATLVPGDLMGVERWPRWTGLHRGDLIVFHDPTQDDRPVYRRRLLVKRIVGRPGDQVELRRGDLLVNDLPIGLEPGQTRLWSVALGPAADRASLATDLGLAQTMWNTAGTVVQLPLNERSAAALDTIAGVQVDGPLPGSRGTDPYLFPFSKNYPWNGDNYGPLHVPGQGDTVRLDPYTLPLYDRIISRYEGNRLGIDKGVLEVNGQPSDRYVIRKDYFFVLGDNRDNSTDSRHWGFVPANHVVGRAGFILLNPARRRARFLANAPLWL